MSRQSNAERIVQYYIDGSTFGLKKDKLRLSECNEIYSHHTLIGKFLDLEYEDRYLPFLVLTMQDFKSQPSWKKHKHQLAHAANQAGIYVIFVPELDIGFGVSDYYYDYDSIKLAKQLIKIADYSQDPDIKTSCCLFGNKPIHGNKPIRIVSSIVAYTYNQKIDGEMVHAEDVLLKYNQCMNINSNSLYSLLEPCYNCLKQMIDNGMHIIAFYHCHKEKWNTPEYIQLTNDIENKTILSTNKKPIIFRKFSITKTIVDKYYGLKEEKING